MSQPRAVLGAMVGPHAARLILVEFGPMLADLASSLDASADEADRATAREIAATLAQMREVVRWSAERARLPASGSPEAVLLRDRRGSSLQSMLGIDEVAGQLGVSDRWVRMLCDSGELPATKSRGRWRISQADVDDYLDGRRTG